MKDTNFATTFIALRKNGNFHGIPFPEASQKTRIEKVWNSFVKFGETPACDK